MTEPAIRTQELGRVYKLSRDQRKNPKNDDQPGERVALADVTLEVHRGELFGLLGSNGAGKTTLIKILTTLLAPTTGSARVLGRDVLTEPAAIRPRINMVSGGETSGYGVLTVRENLWLFAQLYGVPRKLAGLRVDALLEALELTDRADTRVSQLSTGLRQKMNFCRGFVSDPEVLFLDEPTLGLDVTAARALRRYVRTWIGERAGRTLVLTTHYLMEADELCDRIAVFDQGRLVACDTPTALKRRVQRYAVFELGLKAGTNGYHDLDRLPGVRQCTVAAGPARVEIRVALQEEEVVGSVVRRVVESGSQIVSLRRVEPTLEDVFVTLVGHGLRMPGVDT